MNNRENTLARLKLLSEALQTGKKIPASFAKACQSQGGLANYCYAAEHITPMALNTLKTCANKFIEDGGWEKLDALRKSYLSVQKKHPGPTQQARPQIEQLKEKLVKLENTLDIERRYRIRVQVAYEALLAKVRTMAKTDPELVNFINRHVAGFSHKRISLTNQETQNHEL